MVDSPLLATLPVLNVDCQATGANPQRGHLLELAHVCADGGGARTLPLGWPLEADVPFESGRRVPAPPGQPVPARNRGPRAGRPTSGTVSPAICLWIPAISRLDHQACPAAPSSSVPTRRRSR